MRYRPKPGTPEGYCIGMLPRDREVWDQVMEEVQKQRDDGELEVPDRSDPSVDGSQTSDSERIQALAYLFRVLSGT